MTLEDLRKELAEVENRMQNVTRLVALDALTKLYTRIDSEIIRKESIKADADDMQGRMEYLGRANK